ncbi:MAG: O-antigen ligase family protein [Burkholderiales bacterium]
MLQPSDGMQLAVTSFFQFLVLVALALTQRRNVTWSLLTGFAVLAASFAFVIGNGSAILLTAGEGGLFENPNALGASALALALLCWRVCRWLKVSLRSLVAPLLVALAGLVVYSGARAAVAAGTIAVLWLICSRLASERVTRVIFGLVVLVAVSLAPLVVIFGSEFIDWTTQMDLLGKSVLTGRDEIWPFVILGILEHPWLGHGAGALPGGLLLGRLEGLSAHNGFLQLAFQFGVIGVVIFVGFILAVGLTKFAGESRASREVTRAILIAAVLHEVFEVMLTQNHFGIGFAFWVAAVASHTPQFVRRKTGIARRSHVSLAERDASQTPEWSQA